MRYSETITIEDLDTDPFPHYARLRATDPIAPVRPIAGLPPAGLMSS
jgi:hypothetical protein